MPGITKDFAATGAFFQREFFAARTKQLEKALPHHPTQSGMSFSITSWLKKN
jgi:hypothetical protein